MILVVKMHQQSGILKLADLLYFMAESSFFFLHGFNGSDFLNDSWILSGQLITAWISYLYMNKAQV